MAEPLTIEIPRMRYDITMPILDGRVTVEGVSFKKTSALSSMINHTDSPLATGEFGLADLNLGYFLPAIEAGWELVGLPVFTKRKPVFPMIFCRSDRGIESPRDLIGKRVATRQYRTALTVWARGLLGERWGVDASQMEWQVGADEVFMLHPPARPVRVGGGTEDMIQRFLDGEVDVLITDVSDRRLFETLESHPDVGRLFEDYAAEDYRLYQDTGIYTPMHLLVMSRPLAQSHPGLAKRIYDAFETAKAIHYQDQLSDRAGFSVVYLRERVLEQIARWGDPWKYGISANRQMLETFVRYNQEQGMIAKAPEWSRMFSEETLNT